MYPNSSPPLGRTPCRRRLAPAVAVLLALALLLAARPLAAQNEIVSVERAPEWDALFDRDSGWTGADGIFAIPLNGDERSAADNSSDTVFVFSDTFIGDVAADGTRTNARLVNNTMAELSGNDASGAIDFFWSGSASHPAALFVPATAQTQPGDWYWLQDGVAIGETLYIFPLRMTEGDGGVFNFATAGVALLALPLSAPDPFGSAVQVDTPLFLPESAGESLVNMGVGILDNSATAGAPNADGYLYIYGVRNDPFNKKLLVARILPDQISSFGDYRYYDGSGWSAQLADAAPLTDRVSSELSVSPLPDGRYLLVFQKDTLSPVTSVRFGDSPLGPWSEPIDIWSCPEAASDPDIYCYNAKAHPHLSDDGYEVIVSYNVNTFDFFDHFADADIYRPRFLRVTIAPLSPTAIGGARAQAAAGVAAAALPIALLALAVCVLYGRRAYASLAASPPSGP